MTQVTLNTNSNTNLNKLHLAFDLSHKSWKLAFSDGKKNRFCSIEARNLPALCKAIDDAKKKFGLPEDCEVYSCYEAGRDGFWLHRYLESLGITNLVVDSSSIEVNRRKRQVKTDKLETPGCVAEACSFRDNIVAIKAKNTEVWGVSVDNNESHEKFAENHQLPFTLLADPRGKVAEQYGSLRNFIVFKIAKRHSFIIDPQGRLVKI